MRKELEEIEYVCYFKNDGENIINIIDMSDKNRKEKVANIGEPWFESAYENALISLNCSRITDKLYLMPKGVLSGLKVGMSRREKEKYLSEYAKRIVTR